MQSQAVAAIELAEAWATMIHHMIDGATPADAAALAGFAQPAQVARVLVRDPRFRKALADAAQARIECDLLPLSLKVSRDILTDTNPKAVAVRAKLALGIMDRAAKDRAKEEDPTAELHKLSAEQLAQLVAKGIEAEAAEARTVDVTPTNRRNDPTERTRS